MKGSPPSEAGSYAIRAGSAAEIEEVAADKGYHANAAITELTRYGLRTYIPEPKSPHARVWIDKPEEVERAVVNNRRRSRRTKGRRLGRLRSEKVERSFAHLCDTGGARRSWLCGLEKFNQSHRTEPGMHPEFKAPGDQRAGLVRRL